MGEYLLIVAPDRPALCDYLRRQFEAYERVRVVLDRRRGERRRRSASHEPERRRTERRGQGATRPASDWFVIARPQPN